MGLPFCHPVKIQTFRLNINLRLKNASPSGSTINDLGGGGKSAINVFFPKKAFLNFFPRRGLSKFFPGKGPLKFIFSWRRAFNFFFLDFLRAPPPRSSMVVPLVCHVFKSDGRLSVNIKGYFFNVRVQNKSLGKNSCKMSCSLVNEL